MLGRKIATLTLALLLTLSLATATATAQDGTSSEDARADEVKAALQDAYQELQVADTYVSSAYHAGGSTGDLDRRLGSLETRLREGLDLLENRDFDGAEAAATEVQTGARELQNEAEDLGRTSRITKALTRLEKTVDTDRGTRLTEEAREAWQNGDLVTAQQKLKQAQQVERIHDIRTYLEEVDQETDTDLSSFDARLTAIEDQVDQGRDRQNALTFLTRDLRTAVKAVEAVKRAETAIEGTGGSVDLSVSEERLDRARTLLEQGRYGQALNLAAKATNAAEDQQLRVPDREPGLLQRILDAILSVLTPSSTPDDVSLPDPDRLASPDVEVDYRPPTSSRVRAIEFTGLSGELPSDRVHRSAPSHVVTRQQPVRTAAPTPVPKEVHFFLETDDPVPCGTTCRTVTATIHNTGNIDAHNVKVTSTISTGGSVIWEGEETIGTLAPGQTYTTTRTIEVGYWDALKIKQSGGTVTIETVVTSDEKTIELSEERKIA